MVDMITPAHDDLQALEQLSAKFVARPAGMSVDNAELAAIAGSIHARLVSMQKDVFQIGYDLLRAKKLLGHGNFRNWIKSEFAWSVRTAQNFMNVATRLGDKSESLSHLGVEALYKLAAPSTPEEVIEAVTSMAKAGEKVTSMAVKGLVRQTSPVAKKRATASTELQSKSGKAPEAPQHSDQDKSSIDEMTEQAFLLLKAKLEPQRLTRIAYLLARCDLDQLLERLNQHLTELSKLS